MSLLSFSVKMTVSPRARSLTTEQRVAIAGTWYNTAYSVGCALGAPSGVQSMGLALYVCGYDASMCCRCDLADSANPHWGHLHGPYHRISLHLLEARAGHGAQMRFFAQSKTLKRTSQLKLSAR